MGESINIDLQKKVSLTRQELHELETKEKTGKERLIEKLILVLPEMCAVTAILEYMLIPDNSMNRNPYTYLGFLILMMVLYNGYGIAAAILHCKEISGCMRNFVTVRPYGQRCFYCLQVMII